MADGARAGRLPDDHGHGDALGHQPARPLLDAAIHRRVVLRSVAARASRSGSVSRTRSSNITSTRTTREQLPVDAKHRKLLPVETFSVTAGIKGGIVGGIAMIVPATLFGLLRYHSLWYAVNLLAAGGFVSWAGREQRLSGPVSSHGSARRPRHSWPHLGAHRSALRRHAADVSAKAHPHRRLHRALLWTGILYSALGVISPILNERIDWLWFVISQIAFGLVCGFVVNLQVKVRTPQFRALPFAVRAGLHSDQIETKDDKK